MRKLVTTGAVVIVAAGLIYVAVFQMDGMSAQRRGGAMGAYNGFDVSNALIPKDQIFSGGPGKDGIPAISNPKFVAARDVDYLSDADKVVGVVQGDVARAYPLRIIVWHEIINDVVDGKPLAITYCPLCGTCMVFDREIDGKTLSFGVSGLLYQSDVLMYDRQTDSLWSQLMMKSVAGKNAGTKLKWLPSEEMTWGAWKERYPDSEVLSTDTGYRRSYDGKAYASYFNSDRVMFPVPHTRRELRNKEWVVGVIVDGIAKAYPLSKLEYLGDAKIHDIIGDTKVVVTYDAARKWPKVKDAESGEDIPSVSVYWFAWQAFYPTTELYTP